MDWATLPKELLTTIFSFLKCADLTSVVCVNSTWHTFADYNNIWREAILNDSFPQHYSASQKNVPWRQIAKKHFETKRNIIKKRCVQHTLGTRCPTTQRNTTIVLATKTANAKYCILIWDMIEVQGYSYQNNTRLATELWDLETRTIISNHTSPQLQLFNDFVVKSEALQNYSYDGQCVTQTFYSKFDPDEKDITPKKVIYIETTNYAYLSATYNEDPNSSLAAFNWSNWTEKELFLSVYDLRAGEKIFEKKFENADNLVVVDFYGDKLLLRYHNNRGYLLVLDVFRNTEELILVESLCATMAGDKVWAATNGGLVKYDIQTKEQIEYKLSETIGSVTSMRVYDGLIWLFIYGTRISIVDVSSGSATGQILTQITLPGWDKPTVTPLANGTFACLATSYAHILSFKDEDIELPIEVLQFEPNGKSEILRIAQGDLNNIVLEYSSTSVSSQIVFEDEKQRYCVIYTFDTKLKDKGVNQFVEKAKKKWIEKPEYNKTAIFQLVHFNSSHCTAIDVLTPKAFGRAWVIYETKVNGAWQRTAPLDHWKFFKKKLGLEYEYNLYNRLAAVNMDWATLPEELLTTIFSFLACADLTRVICVNATWHALADYNNIWKEAILNDSFPHHYSTSQKNVPWLQVAKQHFETKRNIIKKRCVQHTLSTWCPGSNKNIRISITGSKTVNAKHCILAWETNQKQDFYLVNINHLATELWDLETRTIVSVVQTMIKANSGYILNPNPKRIELFNDFVIEVGSYNVFYSKFDPVDISPKTEISIQNTDPDDADSKIWVNCNEDPNSSLIAVHWRTPNDEDWEYLWTVIYDLRTGEKIFEKKYIYEIAEVLLVDQFYGDKILMRNYNIYGHLLVVDIFQNTEVLIEVEAKCATMAGNNVWLLTNGGSLIRYDIQSKERIEYKMSEQIHCDTYMRVHDGLLWFFASSTTITVADVSSGSTCQILTQMTCSTLPGMGDKPTVTKLANGTYACISSSYAHILSFKDEDIELPIEVLQFEPNGKSEILRIAQGDLNKMIAEYSSTSVSSQIVFEDETQRYCVIFTYKTDLEDKDINQFAETAKNWLEKPEYHKTAIFQLVHFDSECKPLQVLNPTAFGRAWVIYETKVNGAWQRTAPLDHWKFFKKKLGLE